MPLSDRDCIECRGLGYILPQPYTILTAAVIARLRQRICPRCHGTRKEPYD